MNYYTNAIKHYIVEIVVSIVALIMLQNPFKGFTTYKQYLKQRS